MAHASRPPSGQNGQIADSQPAILPPRSAPPASAMETQMAGVGHLEMVELSSKPVIEGILGPNKDGRVRNPVPGKLKGKTDNKKGNFGVMHMAGVKNHEILGKDAAAERDAAARRTSENTASRAKASQQEKYIPPKKRGLEAAFNEATRNASRSSPFGRDDKRQARPLAPDETKSEQARLLTLLRSINPVTVVDQICKAVAYFGGIPGAPPPEDGIFPESANTRETGALFIGWLAEIFPDLSANSPEFMKAPDIGKKKARASKGHQMTMSNAGLGAATFDEGPNSRNGYGYGPAVSAPAWGLPTNLAEVNPQAPSVPEAPMQTNINNEQPKPQEQQPTPVTPAQPAPAEPQPNAASASTKRRGRGRPKGSTNKKLKGDNQPGEFNGGAINGDNDSSNMNMPTDYQQSQQAQEMAGTALDAADQDQTNFHPAINSQAMPKAAQPQYSDQSWQNNTQKNMGQPSVIIPDELSPEERAVLEAFRTHGTDSLATNNPIGQAVAALPSPVVSTKGPTEGGVKRKRAPAKPKQTTILPPKTVSATTGYNAHASTSYPPQGSPQVQQQQVQTQATQFPQKAQQMPQQAPQAQQLQQKTQKQSPLQKSDNVTLSAANNDNMMSIPRDSMQWASVDANQSPIPTPTAPPPAKKQRQRKSKVPAIATPIEPPSRTQTASVVSAPTPTIPPSTIPDSQASTSTQQSVAPPVVTRPPADGLEAHYERFASLSQQQNGRSNTPTMPQQQHKQQHVRQQSKPSPVPPQQSTPHIPQQMQQQKSQQAYHQNTQLNDIKVDQTATAKAAPSTFYGQRSTSAASYAQQYPSHQASQLYSTQSASPQMSNSNSYRTNSSHTMAQGSMSQASMAQASPQFSQSETYRTASPHVAQPSATFTQTESNYRTTANNNLAQPSPSYSQADNTFRTPATHSMNQGASSYSTSRSNTQPTSTHQGHYNQFSDSSYIDLPTLESLGHSGSSNTASLGGYGQGLSVGLGGTSSSTNNLSRSTGSNSSLYGTTSNSGLGGYDTSAADLLRVSRGSVSSNQSNQHTHTGYGRISSGLGNAFDNDHEMREQLLRGMGRR